MNLLALLLSMWALIITTLFSLIIDARPDSTLSNTSGHVLLTKEEEPISQFSLMDTQSSGTSTVFFFFGLKLVFVCYVNFELRFLTCLYGLLPPLFQIRNL